MAEAHHILVNKTARYYTLGDVKNATEIYFVLHGYGQNVLRFTSKFTALVKPGVAVIAPEGLNRFYYEGFTGIVGAGWMTKDDRLNDIEDYIAYLNVLKKTLCQKRQTIHVLGFSQGAATACRWVSRGLSDAKNLILWAGLVPPDINIDEGLKNLKSVRLIIARSATDEFRTSSMWLMQEDFVTRNSLEYDDFEYEGGHKMVDTALMKLVETYINPLLSN